MALPSHFLDELRARTPMAGLVSRRVKLARSGRQWKGCCPFHGEKTPSFHVYEDGFHCFGCGAHGDAISFVMQTQGAGFMEAVQSLAAEAGLDVPKATPEAAEAERRRLDLHGVLDAACTVYRRNLRAPAGKAALAYLHGRGLTDATIDAFALGWSGEGRGGLAAELARADVTPDQLLQAGLLRQPEPDAAPRELFFNRVMFPIRDRTGRIVSFGGRILGEGQPKYLNGPETELFSKRRTLYALDRAREAVRPRPAAEPPGGTAEVVAVEGYMDVIALHQAGFGAAVAPLGTALGPEQLEALWRLSPTPTLCFDGDAAGLRAAARAADAALPLLGLERSLLIATLPAGQDPDTLVRQGGAAAFRAVLAARTPLPQAIFGLTRTQVGDGSEEQRARLAQALDDKAKLIPHAALSYEFRQTFRGLLNAQRRARPTPGQSARAQGSGLRGRTRPGAPPALSTLPRHHVAFTEPDAAAERRRHLAAIMLHHPGLVHDVEEAWCSLDLPEPQRRLRHAVLAWSEHAKQLDSSSLIAHLHASGLGDEVARITSSQPLPLSAPALADAMPAEAEAAWWHYFGQLNLPELEREVAAAATALRESITETANRRMITLITALDRLRCGEQGEEPGI